jgi:hypothetical protein
MLNRSTIRFKKVFSYTCGICRSSSAAACWSLSKILRFESREGLTTIYAVDFCVSVLWDETPFRNDQKLIIAINKTISHMTYSRDRASQGHAHFEGYEHVHGTVKLMRRTWGNFLKSANADFMRPCYPEDIEYWLDEHTKSWRVKFSDMENEFERRARTWPHWKLNETPDGPV